MKTVFSNIYEKIDLTLLQPATLSYSGPQFGRLHHCEEQYCFYLQGHGAYECVWYDSRAPIFGLVFQHYGLVLDILVLGLQG
jgi:hypothetical protein